MRLLNKIILLTTLWFCSSPNLAEANAPERAKTPYEQQLKLMLDDLVGVTAVPAFSVAIVHRGQLVAAVAAGHADKETRQQVTPAHIFRLASVSKVVGASMLAELVLSNQLDPDLPLSHYYPELNKQYHAITLRQLLAHTSGMPHYQSIDDAISDQHYDSAAAALVTLKNRPLHAAPGEKYVYSSHGYTLAGALYEKISGKTLQTAVPAYIKTLIGKSSPLIEHIPDLHPLSVSLYERNGNQVQKISYKTAGDDSFSVFGASMSATATDLALFGATVLQKSHANDSYRQLLFSPVKTSTGLPTGTDKYQVGFGWRIGKTTEGKTIYHHSGVNQGARTVIMLYPEQELSIAFLSNSSWIASIEETADSLVELYLAGAEPASLPASASYTLTYEGTESAGKLECHQHQCLLLNDQSKLAAWLQKFNPTPQDSGQMPVFVYRTGSQQKMILVSKVGFIHLSAPSGSHRFTGMVSGKNSVSITLSAFR